ncbi:MAG: YfhO family protein [Oscillospiraceae bacterium]|nr:YfhO family protein [Oscillospiraceae bacterium]
MQYSIKKHIDNRSRLHLHNEKHRLRRYFGFYTVIFAFTCFVVFCWYFIPKRTFIWQNDGWTQHYKALVYYAQYMRSIIRELLYNHRVVFPEWNFSFGEGNDILQSLHYYVIGDPFAVFSVFVPTRFLWIYYDFMILLRLYLSGIAFSCLCFYTKKNIGRYAVMAGALSYVFCFWAIFNVSRHPYFLNPMLYYPLIILGIEKILCKDRPYLLIVAVFLAAISNFYYFYNIVFMTVAYVIVRLIAEYKTDLKSMMNALLRISGGAIMGAAMGGIILIPVIYDFLNDSRMGSGNAWHLIYPLSYYSRLLGDLFFGDDKAYWMCMGYAAPVILAIFLLFMRKKQHRLLKACFLVCSVIILIPALGQLLNGMSYMSNKWCWAFALLCAYILSTMWQELMNLKLKDARKLTLALSLCFIGLLIFEYSRTTAAFACIGIAFIFLLVIFPIPIEHQREEICWKKWKQAVAILLVIVSVASISFFKNANASGNYAAQAKEADGVEEQLMLTEAKAVQYVADLDDTNGFYRYSGRNLTHNTGTLYNISNTNYYWSLANPAMASFRNTLELREPLLQLYKGYDDRTALISLSSVKYYVVPNKDKEPIPYGFTYVDKFNVKKSITEETKELLREELGVDILPDYQIKVIENATASTYKVYRNDNALPISYVYDSVISTDQWDKLSSVEKQEAMLQSVMLAEYDGKTQDNAVNYSSQSLDYCINCNAGVTLEDYGFVVTSENATATINFEGLANSETYFKISGLNFDGVSTYDLYFGDEKYDPLNLYTETRWNLLSYAKQESARKDNIFWIEPTGVNLTLKSSSGLAKKINYYTEDYSWYNDRHDFTVNLDYTKEAVTSITVTFSDIGIYSFDSIDVICQPMDSYEEQIASLKKNGLENVNIGTDTVSGNISLDKSQVLCFSIPYSAGWTAYVDGEEVTLYQANIKNMAIVLEAGDHDVKLIYHTPYLRLGAELSIAGFVGFSALLLLNAYKKRRLKKNKRGDSQ